MTRKKIKSNRQGARARTKTPHKLNEKMQRTSVTTKSEERSKSTSRWSSTNLKKT
jgi:hypothetical protein